MLFRCGVHCLVEVVLVISPPFALALSISVPLLPFHPREIGCSRSSRKFRVLSHRPQRESQAGRETAACVPRTPTTTNATRVAQRQTEEGVEGESGAEGGGEAASAGGRGKTRSFEVEENVRMLNLVGRVDIV